MRMGVLSFFRFFLVLLSCTVVFRLQAMDIALKSGKVLKNAEVTGITHEHICLMHNDGAANITVDDLSDEGRAKLKKAVRSHLRKRAGYIIRQVKKLDDKEKIAFLREQIKLQSDEYVVSRLRSHITEIQHRSSGSIVQAMEKADTVSPAEAIKILQQAIAQNPTASNLEAAEKKLEELQQAHGASAIKLAMEKSESVLQSENDIVGAIIILEDALKKYNDDAADEAVTQAGKRLAELRMLRDTKAMREAMREAENLMNSDLKQAIRIMIKAVKKNKFAGNFAEAQKFLNDLKQTYIDNLFKKYLFTAKNIARTRADKAMPILREGLAKYPGTSLKSSSLKLLEEWKFLQIQQKISYMRNVLERIPNMQTYEARRTIQTALKEYNHDFSSAEQAALPGATELKNMISQGFDILSELNNKIREIEDNNLYRAINYANNANTYREQISILSGALASNPDASDSVRQHAQNFLYKVRNEYEQWRRANARTCWKCDGRGSYMTSSGFVAVGGIRPTYRNVTCEYCMGSGVIMPD